MNAKSAAHSWESVLLVALAVVCASAAHGNSSGVIHGKNHTSNHSGHHHHHRHNLTTGTPAPTPTNRSWTNATHPRNHTHHAHHAAAAGTHARRLFHGWWGNSQASSPPIVVISAPPAPYPQQLASQAAPVPFYPTNRPPPGPVIAVAKAVVNEAPLDNGQQQPYPQQLASLAAPAPAPAPVIIAIPSEKKCQHPWFC